MSSFCFTLAHLIFSFFNLEVESLVRYSKLRGCLFNDTKLVGIELFEEKLLTSDFQSLRNTSISTLTSRQSANSRLWENRKPWNESQESYICTKICKGILKVVLKPGLSWNNFELIIHSPVMLLTFKTLQGQTFTLEVDPSITVRYFC